MDNTIRVLVIGDPHFKVANSQETEEMVQEILRIARELAPTFIVCLGDTLDKFANIHVGPLVRATLFLKSLSDIAPLFLLIGNHDRINNNAFCTEHHPFVSLKTWKNTTIVDEPLSVVVEGMKFVFVPYVSCGRFHEALSLLDESYLDAQCIFAHQEFKGAKMGAIMSEHGDEWSLDAPLVISGHIHDYDRLQANILYVGTPIQHGFADKNDKTISLITFSEGKWEEERIELPLVKKKKTVRLPVSSILGYVPPEDVILKIVLYGSGEEIRSIMKSDQIAKLRKKGIKIVYQQTNQEKEQIAIRPSVGFKVALYGALSGKPHSQLWFEHLFGKPHLQSD